MSLSVYSQKQVLNVNLNTSEKHFPVIFIIPRLVQEESGKNSFISLPDLSLLKFKCSYQQRVKNAEHCSVCLFYSVNT